MVIRAIDNLKRLCMQRAHILTYVLWKGKTIVDVKVQKSEGLSDICVMDRGAVLFVLHHLTTSI